MMIIGAGATAYSEHANPDRRPPMSNNDLLRMYGIEKSLFMNSSNVNEHTFTINIEKRLEEKSFFDETFKLYQYDIEALFTGIFTLIHDFNIEDHKLTALKLLVKKFNVFNLTNLITNFSVKLFLEINRCLGTTEKDPYAVPKIPPVCSWHRKLARELNTGDVIVNFNYDSVMADALLSEKKLSIKSFLNSHIRKSEIDIPQNLLSKTPIVLITPHGSFTWRKRLPLNFWDHEGNFHASENFLTTWIRMSSMDLSRLSPKQLRELNYKLDPAVIRIELNNNSKANFFMSEVILPLKNKKTILEFFPVFNEEYNLFLKNLEKADIVYLIGKNFIKSDQDIAEDIENFCSKKKRHLIYIDPNSMDDEWINHHNRIFNASSCKPYEGLFAYIMLNQQPKINKSLKYKKYCSNLPPNA